MTPQSQVFKLALQQFPLSIGLVLSGRKPMSYCLVKVPSRLGKKINNRFKKNIVNNFKGCGYFCFPRYRVIKDKSDLITTEVSLLIYNDQSLIETIPVLRDNQSSFEFKSAESVRKAIILFFKNIYKPHKYSPLEKQDITTLCGIAFGYPLKSTLKFALEALRGEMFEERFGFWVKSEPNLVFVGYPDTVQESKAKIKEWTNFKRTKQFKDILKKLKP